MEEGSRQFLPPKPAGPEPELGARPAPPSFAPAAEAASPPSYAPPAEAGAPPAQAQQPAWGHQAPPVQQPAWGHQAPPAQQPDNGPAVAGFVLSLVSGGLLVITLGISSLVSLACAILGLVYSRRGKRKVESGETSKNAGLANAGWVISIVSLVLSVLATLMYVALVIALATDAEFRDDFERELDNSETIRAALRLAVALVT
jgi:hypothetical protein